MHSSRPTIHHVKRNYFLISCVVVCEPISSTMLLPFVYFMVRDFGYADKDIGKHAGWLTSCFFAVQMVFTPLWSVWSNKIGRKTTLLLGLLSTALSMVLFGLSKSLSWAIVSRCICAMLNGNAPVARTMVGEMTELTGGNKGKAFSLFGFCLATGWMVGPLIGGALARPSEHLTLFRGSGTFEAYPYVLPCLVTSLINIAVFIASMVLLEDTHIRDQTPSKDANTPVETDPLLVERDTAQSEPRVTEGPAIARSNRRVQVLCGISALFFFTQAILFDELFALFAASSADAGSGLSFLPRDIAAALTSSGPAMLATLVAYPFLHKYVRALRMWQWSGIFFAALYPSFSLLPQMQHLGPAPLWGCLIVLIMLRYAAFVVSLTSLNIMLNDVVIPQERALMNGIGQAIGSLARTVGPTLGGYVWSWSLSSGLRAPLDFHACFLLLGILSMAQGVVAIWIDEGSH